jgi:hypothetical protein
MASGKRLKTFRKHTFGTIVMSNDIQKAILAKLHRHGYIGGRHTSIDNIPKGFPKHVYGKVKKVAKELTKQNLIIVKPTAYGLQASLNPYKMDEIEKIIRDP